MAGGAVGPLGIVDPEDDRRVLGEPLEQGEQRLERAPQSVLAIGVARAGRAVGRSELGYQPCQAGSVAGREFLERRLALADQCPQRPAERGIRELVGAELDALAAEAAPSRLARPLQQLVQQPRLADARFAGDEGQPRRPRRGLSEGGLELGELSRSSNQFTGTDSGCHSSIIASRGG